MANWFVPKKYGFGARPNSWQGWLATILFCLIIAAATQFLNHNRWAAVSAIVTATMIFMLIAINNTRGGWRWRWGKGDE